MDKLIRSLVFLVIIAGIFIYFVGRAPEFWRAGPSEGKPPFFSNFNLFQKLKSTSTTGFTPYLPPWNPTFAGGGFSGIFKSFFSGSYSGAGYNYAVPQGFTREQISPYFQKIKLGSAYSYFGSRSQIQVYSYLALDERVNVTGWRIKGRRGEAVIPKAVSVYEPIGLALQEDIVISGNTILNIYGATSPIGVNFRPNKCTGYLQQGYNFNPPIPQNCPIPYDRYKIQYLSGYCQNYIMSLGGCRLPDDNFMNSLPGNTDGNNCRSYLSKINMTGCFEKHRADPDFLSNTYMIYGTQLDTDPYHDTIQFLDNKGLLVDQYNY